MFRNGWVVCRRAKRSESNVFLYFIRKNRGNSYGIIDLEVRQLHHLLRKTSEHFLSAATHFSPSALLQLFEYRILFFLKVLKMRKTKHLLRSSQDLF